MREFVEQLDDGIMPGNPNLTRDDEQVMTAGNIARCHPEQIHSIWIVGKDISMSLHTYGRHINYTGRSQFDLEHKREKPYVIKVADDERVRAWCSQKRAGGGITFNVRYWPKADMP